MTDNLIARLKAGLDEDERVALEAKTGYPGLCYHDKTGRWGFDGIGVGDENGEAVVEDHGSHPEITPHIARHDPARVLRWVKAAREILDEHRASDSPHANGDRSCLGCGAGSDGEMLVADVNDCPVLCALASVYGDEET